MFTPLFRSWIARILGIFAKLTQGSSQYNEAIGITSVKGVVT